MSKTVVKYQQYAEYKDSGVEWLGEVPSHWDLKPSKFLFNIVNGSTPKSGVEEYWEGDITWVTPSDLSKIESFEISESARSITNKGLDSCGTSLVPSGSLILSCRAPIGSLAITTTEVCTNQGCKSLVAIDEINTKFIYYFLSVSTEQLNILGRGTTFLELSSDELGNLKIPFPVVNEAEKIANFLDHETAKIDSLIVKQEKLIELLKEKRQAVISHAVTKGLNPNVPMKDSGVEWLGEVPEHWITSRLKYYTNQIVDGAHFTPTYTESGIPFLRVTDIHNDFIDMENIKYIPKVEHQELIKRCLPKKGDLLLSKNGTIGVPKLVNWDWEFSIFVSLCLIKFKKTLMAEFAEYFFKSYEIQEQIFGLIKKSTVINLHLDKIQNFWFSIPSVNEQIEIVNFLNHKTNELDNLISKAELAIQLMQERRTALISAAVTGKIDVRNWQNPTEAKMEFSA